MVFEKLLLAHLVYAAADAIPLPDYKHMDISTLSSLPTDSLYKFIALSGIVILAISVILPEIVRKRFKFQVFDISRDIEIHRINSENIEEQLSHLQKNNEGHKQKYETIINRGGQLTEKEMNSVYEIQKEIDDVRAKSIELRKVTFQIDCEMKKIEFFKRSLTIILSFQLIGLGAGLVFSLIGLYLWYSRLQVYIDAATKAHGT